MILDDINKRIISSMKTGGDKTTISTLKMLKAELLTNSKNAKPRPEVEVIKSYLKKLKDSRQTMTQACKFDEVEKLDIEIATTESILPEGVPESKILEAILSAIKAMGDDYTKQPGRIIGTVKKALPDADGDKIRGVLDSLLITGNK